MAKLYGVKALFSLPRPGPPTKINYSYTDSAVLSTTSSMKKKREREKEYLVYQLFAVRSLQTAFVSSLSGCLNCLKLNSLCWNKSDLAERWGIGRQRDDSHCPVSERGEGLYLWADGVWKRNWEVMRSPIPLL